jgi:hypothetical protein
MCKTKYEETDWCGWVHGFSLWAWASKTIKVFKYNWLWLTIEGIWLLAGMLGWATLASDFVCIENTRMWFLLGQICPKVRDYFKWANHTQIEPQQKQEYHAHYVSSA